ncbi:MAG: type secretion system major pseudopilin GspG [Pseudomonadota bacterium]|jgi:general secretion pathway protein G
MKNLQSLKDERGLTLVEIVVVLIILGLVMTFVGGKVLGAGDKAKADLTQLKMKEVAASIEQFQLRYNGLPQSLAGLTQCTAETGEGCVPITKEDSLKDAWGNPFSYSLENNGRSYRIKSLGADAREGGDGVNYDSSLTGP